MLNLSNTKHIMIKRKFEAFTQSFWWN